MMSKKKAIPARAEGPICQIKRAVQRRIWGLFENLATASEPEGRMKADGRTQTLNLQSKGTTLQRTQCVRCPCRGQGRQGG